MLNGEWLVKQFVYETKKPASNGNWLFCVEKRSE
jgi:hypothetical protein